MSLSLGTKSTDRQLAAHPVTTPRTVYVNGRFLTQNITGVQRYAHELLSEIDAYLAANPDQAAQLRVTILAPSRGLKFQPRWPHLGFRQIGRLSGHLWEQMELPFAARDGLLFCPANTAPIASLLGRKPVVVCVHSLAYRYFPAAYTAAFRAVYTVLTPLIMKFADGIITVSESERDMILRAFPGSAARLTVIQNGGWGRSVGGELERIAPLSLERPYILYVGSLNKCKNFSVIMRCAIKLVRDTDLNFMFVGGFPSVLQQSEVAIPEELRDRIIMTGQVDDVRRLIAAYKGASVFVFPSLYEASPFPPIEAMAFGVPVVASSIPPLQERCGDAAVYCDPTSVESVTEAVTSILNDAALRDDLRRRGLERAAVFTWEACARDTLAVIAGVG